MIDYIMKGGVIMIPTRSPSPRTVSRLCRDNCQHFLVPRTLVNCSWPVKSLRSHRQVEGIFNAAILSEGIHNVLIITMAGLCVAIPSLVAYNYLTRKVEGLVLEVERVPLRLLNILKR